MVYKVSSEQMREREREFDDWMKKTLGYGIENRPNFVKYGVDEMGYPYLVFPSEFNREPNSITITSMTSSELDKILLEED